MLQCKLLDTGAWGKFQENTLAGFRKAIKQGADGIELDIHLSKDNVPYVIHDNSLTKKCVLSFPLEDVCSCEDNVFDSYSSSRIKKELRVGETRHQIPKLIDVLQLVEAHNERRKPVELPPLIVNVELKGKQEGLVSAIYQTVQDFLSRSKFDGSPKIMTLGDFYFNSFDHEKLREMKGLDSSAAIVPVMKTTFLFGKDQVGSNFEVDPTALYRQGFLAELSVLINELRCRSVDIMLDDLRPSLFDFLEKNHIGLFTSTSFLRTTVESLIPTLKVLVAQQKSRPLPTVIVF